MKPSADARYTRRARSYHWLVFAFVALAYLLINVRGFAAKGGDVRTLSMQGHILAGLIVLALVLPRLLHRLRHTPPPVVPPLTTWESRLSRLTHFLLYTFLIVQPLLGLLTVFVGGHGVIIPYTHVQIPSPMAANRALSEKFGNLHGWIGTIFYYVIGLHILGAAWHHFVRHDNTLQRMT